MLVDNNVKVVDIVYDLEFNCYLHNNALILDLECFIAKVLTSGKMPSFTIKEMQ